MNFTARSGAVADLEVGTFSITTDSAGPAIASNLDWCIKHGSVRLLDNGDELVIIHIDGPLVTNHSNL